MTNHGGIIIALDVEKMYSPQNARQNHDIKSDNNSVKMRPSSNIGK
jgi:hypothetical protein